MCVRVRARETTSAWCAHGTSMATSFHGCGGNPTHTTMQQLVMREKKEKGKKRKKTSSA